MVKTVDLSLLDGTNGFTLNGIDRRDASGYSVSSAGDVNGDGYDDLIIGARGAGPDGKNPADETYVVYGGASAPGANGVLDLSALDGTIGFTLTGIEPDDESGRSVSSAGDVNGDGYDDLIIGARSTDPNGARSGHAYVVYGGASAPGTDGVLALSALDGASGFTLNGIDPADVSGASVSSAGDVNGDGYDDLIIGSRGADPNGARSGKTHVVYGGASAPGTDAVLDLSALDGSSGFTLTGIDPGDVSGYSVSSAGDVNGDGYDDLIIGARGADPNGGSSGETYVVYGGASAPGTDSVLNLSALDGTNGFTLAGIDPGDRSGTSVSSAGDVNGDGYGDLIIGASRADPNGRSSGETHVVYGGASAPGTDGVLDLSALDGTNGFTLTGIDPDDESGRSVSSAGDVNGDGYDDLIIGARFADPNGARSGETYVVYGGARAPGTDGVLALSALDGANGFILTGVDPGDRSGVSVSSAGDVNGDGYDDLIIGAPGADPNGRSSGETYVIYGGATGTESMVPVTARGTVSADSFTGNAGADTFTEIAAGDVVRGGAGDDRISVTSLDFAHLDGGTGTDTLALDALAGPGLSLDLTGAGRTDVDADSVEVIDLSGTGADRLVVDALAVFDLTEERDGGMATLDVLGDADDTVELRDFIFDSTETEDGTTYDVYRDGNAQVRVQDGVAVAPFFTSAGGASVAENQSVGSVVYTAVAAGGDPDGGALTYSLSGTDAALFTIDADTGEVRFRAVPDFENPADDDGDNVHEVTVTASDGDSGDSNRTDHAVAITVTDAYDEIALSGLDGTNGFTLTGIDRFDWSGYSVSSAGDVNGDGYDDLIIGARGAGPDGRNLAGETYVVYGGVSAAGTDGVLDLSALDGTNGFTLTGIDPGDLSGASVSSAGDVNGDGYDDLIIGASRADPNGHASGETHVVYGGARAPGTDGVLALSALDGTNGFTLTGSDPDGVFDASVSSAGDVNGDGYDDLIIGARGANPNGARSGETYVVHGGASTPGTDGVLDLSALDGASGFTLTGIDPGDVSGYSVSSAGDVNGDGYDDLIIGARGADPNGSRSGETYVVHGGARAPGTDGVLALSGLDGSNGFVLTGIDPGDRSGRSVSSAGDVNGDGYDDLIIGANRADPGGSRSGETHVIYGGARAPGTDGVLALSALDGTNGFTVTGIDPDDESGRSVSSAGDVNGDGYDDLIIGARGADPNGDRSGETYVVYGGARAPGTDGVLSLSALDGANGFILTGIDPGDRSGVSVSSAGDVNGDGYDDLIIGAPGADPNGRSSGETHVVYGGATGTESTVPVTAQGTGSADSFTGNAGADTFTDIATGDVVRGGAGDDRISVTALDFAHLDGGTGTDTLVLDALAGPGLSLDLTGAGRTDVDADSVEVIDLSGTGADRLVVDALAVSGLTEERDGGMATLDVLGDADDTVELRDFIFDSTETGDGTTYDVYRDGNAQVRVQDGVAVAPFFTSAGQVSMAENPGAASVVYTAVAVAVAAGGNADGGALTYSLSGTDAALFTIDADTGEVRFRAAPDFENPADDNGDNVHDITVTASDGGSGNSNRTDHAVAITVTDAYDEIALSGLDGTNGFTVTGIDPYDYSGVSVSSAGDVNGDGYDDLIIGSRGAGPNGESYAGEIHVVYGGARAPGTDGVLALSALDGANGFTLTGIDPYDYAGISVSSAGDVNGDGYDDLIIGADGADSDAGETHVVYGARAPGTNGVLALSALDGTNGFTVSGRDPDDESGASVSSAGDVNGDGYDDLIIGARGADPVQVRGAGPGGVRSGETHVVYGGASAPGTDGVLALSALDGTNGFTLSGIDPNDLSGYSVSSAGDVNGDGYDDLIIGARGADPNGSRSGEAHVVYGGASAPGTDGVLALSALDGTNGFTLTGIDPYDYAGVSVSSAGDVNGDGYDDLIIGARGADPNGRNSGETHVVYGGARAPGTDGVLDLSALDGTNGFTLTGTDAGDESGASVSSAGDVNGDGYDDLIIGARGGDPNEESDAGETYVVYGGASALGANGVLALSALDGTNGFVLTGTGPYDYAGVSVSSAGDVNGDGYDDLIIGADGADPNGLNSGETHVVYGGATGTERTVPVTAQGTVSADSFTGNAGADTFTEIAADDVVRGGAGDDRISVTALDFAHLDGGTGTDTLVLDGPDLSLDLTGAGTADVDSVEVIDLSGTGADTLVLDALAVFDVTEERDGGMASLDVLGDADDTVDLRDGNFIFSSTETDADATYDVYRDGNAQVRVQDGVVIKIAPVFTSAGAASVVENQSAASVVYTAVAGNADGDTLTYSLSGTDADLFTIDPDTGEVRFRAVPDFEMPADDDRDNVHDVTVTASDGDSGRTDHTVAITVTDENHEIALSGLDGTNGFTLTGIDRDDFSGASVSSAGDVNGDGYDDLIIGAPRAGPNGHSSGETYVVYGGVSVTDTDGVLAPSTLDGTNGFTLTGTDTRDFSGVSVSSAGDVNGDGYDDLIIGASGADANGKRSAGETYVVYGGASVTGTDGALALSALDGTNGFALTGIDALDYSGYSVSSAGDVNGDGYDDLIIGALGADPNGESGAGETHVVYGGARAPGKGGVLAVSALNGTNGFTLTGINSRDRSGHSVSSAGDVNGDGYDDLIIGAPGAGETYVVYGGTSALGADGVLDLTVLDGTNGFTLTGIDRDDQSGASVSSAGDVNGDGYDDLIIGAPGADPNGERYAGETYVVYGGVSAPGTDGVLELSALNGTNGFTVTGINSRDYSGGSVSSAGDVNGDGYDDLIIGASKADPDAKLSAGETYVVYGGAHAPGANGVFELSTLDGASGLTLTGSARFDWSGYSVSSAGDVNGDGYDDLIIGARGADPNGSRSGETYVVFGGATGTESIVPVMAQGTVFADNFTGNAGADTFTDIATDDVVRGGAGDDRISVTSLDFAHLDGGTGRDTLVLDALAGPGLSLDLTHASAADVDSVEVLDLSGTGADTLVLDALAVSDVTEERDGGMATLDVRGDADDMVELRGFGFSSTETEAGATYNVYRDGNAQVRVQDGLVVKLTPVFTSASVASLAENTAAGSRVYTAMARDADGDALTYSLSGTDAGLFTINRNSGRVRIMAAPDFENPADDDGDNVHEVTVTVSDGDGNRTDHAVAIRVTDENDGPVFTSSGRASVAENLDTGSVVHTATAVASDAGAVTYGLSGTDAALFTIDEGSGEVRFRAAPDYENPADDDGDNVYRVTVTASDGDGKRTGHEVVITVTDDTEDNPVAEVALSALDGTNGFTLTGIDLNGYAGVAISSAGDVNGDGYDDLIIGVFRADPNGKISAGETHVVYGGASVTGTDGALALSALDGTNGFTLTGIDRFDFSGKSVSSAGDVNGDGYDDLIIGAHRASPDGEISAGETYVIYGGAHAPGTGGVFELSALDGTNGFTLTGSARLDGSGQSVSSAGDVNGDGYDDLIIGAPRADPNGDRSGETYVVYGGASAPGTDGVLALSTLDGANGFTLTGIDRYGYSGYSVSSAGDVNGDGYDDLIIGAHRADPNGQDSGETHVVYGGASAPGTAGVLELSALDGTNGFTLKGSAGVDWSGRSVSSAGDVNGDGYDDLIIGAPRADPNGKGGAGETYVVYGGASAPGTDGVLELPALDGTNGFTLTGIDRADWSGFSVSSAGDVNGDGYDDLIIGARFADPNGERSAGESYVGVNIDVILDDIDDNTKRDAGETYVVYGGASAPGTGGVFELSALDGASGFTLTGVDAFDQSGRAVSSAGDVNGDGYDDLFIGAPLAEPHGERGAGEAYVVYGGATGTESTVPVTAQGTVSADNFTGNAGADTFTEIATDDVVRGGAGDDRISVTSLDFAHIDGGTGRDTLALDALAGPGLLLDLTGAGTADVDVDSVEVIDLSGTVADRLVLDALAVFGLTEERDGGMATLNVGGDADDTVELRGFIFDSTETEDGTTYGVYRDGNAQVRVQDGVAVAPFFTSAGGASVAENLGAGSVVYTAVAGDPDGGAPTYRLSGTDADPFTINADTGEVRFRAAPDFENPADDDGDNVHDITVTASDRDGNSTDHAIAITVTNDTDDDGGTALSELDGTNGFTLTGINPYDDSGFSVSSAGDVNGDGYDDLIVGARGGSPNGESYAGETHVVYGGANAPGADGVLALSALDGTNGFTLTGIDPYDYSGASVSSAGDVNGDGYDDLIIGARGGDPNGESDAGETYVVYGGANAPGADGVLALSALDGTNGFTLTGIDPYDDSGYSVSSAGDVNGDGYDDLIIGARGADPHGSRSGETHVVYGGTSVPGTGGVLALSALDGTNGFTLTGIDALDDSGYAVSSAGDVNGDGYDDLIIGARGADPNGDRSGETHVVYGGARAPGTDGVLALSALDGTNGFTLTGIDPYDYAGVSVSSAADVNGDGYDDLIIGARGGGQDGKANAGETHVVYGGASAPGTDGVLALSALDGTSGFTLTGIDPGDVSGTSVSSAGDVNGDGYDDLIIGARGGDPNGESDAGETYVVYGGANAPGTDGVLALSALDGTSGFAFTGIDRYDNSGFSVSSAGDVNGDGYDDLIIGATGADPNEAFNAGEAYVVFGGATGSESIVPVMAQGTGSADNFTGNAGADTFTEIASGDVVRGGAGDDRISVTALDFAHLDGGTGRDTLVLTGPGLSLDLTHASAAGVDVDSVEVLDLSGTGADRLVLDALAVFDLTEERDGGMAILDVLGDADDMVDLSVGNFIFDSTETEAGTNYDVYRDGNAEVRVQDGVSVTLAASGLQSDLDRIQQEMEMFTSLVTNVDTEMDGS